MEDIYEMKGAGRSIQRIAETLGIARKLVGRYLKSPEGMRPRHNVVKAAIQKHSHR